VVVVVVAVGVTVGVDWGCDVGRGLGGSDRSRGVLGLGGHLFVQRSRSGVFRLVREHFVEHRERAGAMPLPRVDLRKRHRRNGRRDGGKCHALQTADQRRRIRQMQPPLDHTRHEIARDPEQATSQTPLNRVGDGPFDDFVDELDSGEDVGVADPERFGPSDEIASAGGIEIGGLKDAHRG
jgi:hypothetical protein